jgi:hypothetical protein
MLKLLIQTLPQMGEWNDQHINQWDIFEKYTTQLAAGELYKQISKETVPLSENRMQQYRELACSISTTLFHSGTTSAVIYLTPTEHKLISGIPVLHMADSNSIFFTHKSLQEYFTMRAWRDVVLPVGT